MSKLCWKKLYKLNEMERDIVCSSHKPQFFNRNIQCAIKLIAVFSLANISWIAYVINLRYSLKRKLPIRLLVDVLLHNIQQRFKLVKIIRYIVKAKRNLKFLQIPTYIMDNGFQQPRRPLVSYFYQSTSQHYCSMNLAISFLILGHH